MEPHYSSMYHTRLLFYELLTRFPGVAIISVVYFRNINFFFSLNDCYTYGLLALQPSFPPSQSRFTLLGWDTSCARRRSQRQPSDFHSPDHNLPLKVIAAWLTPSVIISRNRVAEWWWEQHFVKPSLAWNMRHGSCWAVSMFVSAYLVSHNILYQSVMFWQQNIIPQATPSGCHFTKPGRLLEITSICGKTNERRGWWCKTSLLSSAVPTRTVSLWLRRWIGTGPTSFSHFSTLLSPSPVSLPHFACPCFFFSCRPSSVLSSVRSLRHEQPRGNTTPLTWRSQQSVDVVGAELFKKPRWFTVKLKTRQGALWNLQDMICCMNLMWRSFSVGWHRSCYPVFGCRWKYARCSSPQT